MLEFSKKIFLIRIVDDNEDHLDALRFSLEAEGWTVACYSDPDLFLEELDLSIPGCVLLDVKMPKLSGPKVQEALNEFQSFLPVIFITAHGDMNLAIRVFRAGAFDFLQKPLDFQELSNAVMRAIEHCQEKYKERLSSSPEARFSMLTERQKQVILAMASGLESPLIAERLQISPRTLQRHRQNALKIIGLKAEDLRDFVKKIRG